MAGLRPPLLREEASLSDPAVQSLEPPEGLLYCVGVPLPFVDHAAGISASVVVGSISVVLWAKQCGRIDRFVGTVCYDPDPAVLAALIGAVDGEDAAAGCKRLFVQASVLGVDVAPVPAVVAPQQLGGVDAVVLHALDRPGGGVITFFRTISPAKR